MINIKGLNFSYKGSERLFNNLDLTLEKGKIHGLLGTNGAGKTSLIKAILGLRYPDSGQINVMGYNPSLRQPAFLRDFFLISEELFAPEMSLKKFIGMYSPYYPSFDLTLFFELLSQFKVSKQSFNTRLSMGQRKKAMIAFGLAANTRILVMDEPTNGLDIPSKKQFRKMLSHLINDGRLFLISTHQIRDLHSLIDTVIVLEGGKVIFNQNIMEIEKKIQFVISHEVPSWEDIIYMERVRGGYLALRTQGLQESYEVDIEILFNAVINEPEKFNQLF